MKIAKVILGTLFLLLAVSCNNALNKSIAEPLTPEEVSQAVKKDPGFSFTYKLVERRDNYLRTTSQKAMWQDLTYGRLWKTIKIKDARNYLFSKGMAETMINYDKLFFTKEEMDNRPPKENLKLAEGYTYSGFVDDFGQTRMEISNYGGRLEGAFYFETEQKRYELGGTTSIDEEHYELNEDDITLTAYRNDEVAGTFKGKWIPGKSFSGVWRPEDSSKRYFFNLAMN